MGYYYYKRKFILWWERHDFFDKLRTFRNSVRMMFRFNLFNKYYWRLIRRAFNSYPFDFGYLLLIEQKQIDRQLEYFLKHQITEDDDWEKTVKYLSLAKYLIGVIIDQGTEFYHHAGRIGTVPVKINSDGTTTDLLNGEKAELYRADFSKSKYVYDGPYVNTRNMSRFLNPYEMKTYSEKYMHYIYLAKCKHLYYYIRERYTSFWWD